MKPTEMDSLFLPDIQAAGEADAQQLVAKLMVEEAEPIINGIVARKFGFLPSGRQDDGADVRGDMSLQLLRRLSALRTNPTDTPIANFRANKVVANYSDCADCSHQLSNVLQAKIRGTTIASSIAAELASSGEDFHLGYSQIADDVNQQPNPMELERVSTRRTMVSVVPSPTPPTTPETLPESPEERAVQKALMTGRLEIPADSPLELGVIYARVGLLPEAEQEFKSASCQSPVALKLLKQLRQSR